MTDEDWQKVIAVNLSGAFFMAPAAVEHMIEHGTGRIINMSSAIGETGSIGQVNYAASKSGLFGLTKLLARETLFQLSRAQHPVGAGIGLTVNAVTPGYIATEHRWQPWPDYGCCAPRSVAPGLPAGRPRHWPERDDRRGVSVLPAVPVQRQRAASPGADLGTSYGGQRHT